MSVLRVGVIGCGRPPKEGETHRPGQARRHMLGYQDSPDTTLVAVADISEESARTFQQEFGAERTYADYREMFAKERLDIVSIATWPNLHAQMVCDAAAAGVRGIFCEKPMSTNFGDAKRMVAACEQHGALLAFCHQRRFNSPFIKARELLKSGAIGELRRLEGMCSNLYDWGTHWFDIMFYYNDETPAEWVIAQIDTRGTRHVFGAPCEGQGLSHFKFRNGVRGLMVTGFEADLGAHNRLVGTDGVIEVGVVGGPDLRVMGKGRDGWETIPCSDGIHGLDAFRLAVVDFIDSFRKGREPELSGRRALQATELIFASYESSRRRGRVDLPLDVDDSALQAMLES